MHFGTNFFFWQQMDKLKRQLAEAEAALEARKKPPEDNGPRIVGEGLVIDEWVRLWLCSYKWQCLVSLI
jgi:hypothetical protein